jgi:DNA-directed RNA polymerase
MAQAAIASACPQTTAYTFSEFTGIQYLQIDIASNFGMDKDSWTDRIKWTQENDAQLEALLNQAEEPAMFFAAVQAYRKAQKGLPSGYPISLDATSSGLQILACLTGCETSSRLCNVVPTGKREDAYTNLYASMLERAGDTAKITRDQAKDAVKA